MIELRGTPESCWDTNNQKWKSAITLGIVNKRLQGTGKFFNTHREYLEWIEKQKKRFKLSGKEALTLSDFSLETIVKLLEKRPSYVQKLLGDDPKQAVTLWIERQYVLNSWKSEVAYYDMLTEIGINPFSNEQPDPKKAMATWRNMKNRLIKNGIIVKRKKEGVIK